MNLSKYFNEALPAVLSFIKGEVLLPEDFYEFFVFNSGQPNIYDMKPEDVKGIGLGFDISGNYYLLSEMLSVGEFKQEIRWNLEKTIKKLGLLKFANNEYNAGGFYLGVGDSNNGNVYFYRNYLDWAEVHEIALLANSFTEFLQKLRPVGITFSETGTEYQYLYEEQDSNGVLIGLSTKSVA